MDPTAEKHPNAGVSVGRESLLPSHPLYRPDLQLERPPHVALPPPPRRGQKMTKAQVLEEINSKTEEIIEELSSKGKFLPCEVVKKLVSNLVQNAERTYKCHIPWREVSAFSTYSKLHGRVEELIKVYCLFTPFTSLHELGIALSQSESVATFEELRLGPLIKHPRAKDYFKPPDDLISPPEITIHQLHSYFSRMIDRSKRNEKFKIEDFLEFVRKKEDLKSVEHLCIRIQSFPLLIRVSVEAVSMLVVQCLWSNQCAIWMGFSHTKTTASRSQACILTSSHSFLYATEQNCNFCVVIFRPTSSSGLLRVLCRNVCTKDCRRKWRCCCSMRQSK